MGLVREVVLEWVTDIRGDLKDKQEEAASEEAGGRALQAEGRAYAKGEASSSVRQAWRV